MKLLSLTQALFIKSLLRCNSTTSNSIQSAIVRSSHNEKILGVATISAAAPEVTLYSIENGFHSLKNLIVLELLSNISTSVSITIILQCEDNLGEIILFEIETQRIVHTDVINFELEWLGEGLKSSNSLKGVQSFYNQNNKIVQIAKIIGRPVVAVGDEIGSI
jgi:hypothetical protein